MAAIFEMYIWHIVRNMYLNRNKDIRASLLAVVANGYEFWFSSQRSEKQRPQVAATIRCMNIWCS